MRTVWINGEFLPENEAKVSIFDRGLNFGQSVYEVTPVIDGHYCNWPHHQARLDRSQATAGISDDTAWEPILTELIARNSLAEGRIYLQVTAGETADRAFPMPGADVRATRFAFTQADNLIANPVAQRGQRIVLRPDLRWQLRSAKTTQLLYAVLMKAEAKEAGVDDCWMIEEGPEGPIVTEATSSNAHIIDARGVLVSHPVDHGVLPGVTRINVVAIAKAMGLAVEERPFTPDELCSAREAFSSGAGTLVLPVVEVNGKPIGNGGPGTLTAEIRSRYIAMLRAG